MLSPIAKLWAHLAWADGILLDALRAGPSPDAAVREYGHILGAEEVWLARLEQRPSRTPVWPEFPLDQLESLAGLLHQDYRGFLERLDDRALERVVAYTNTAGKSFENSIQDILLHVALHGQYHRGKVNLILRQEGHTPAPTDYIAYIRGVPAARTDPGTPR
jgi:uncharacterized damage-inducible protein DinB